MPESTQISSRAPLVSLYYSCYLNDQGNGDPDGNPENGNAKDKYCYWFSLTFFSNEDFGFGCNIFKGSGFGKDLVLFGSIPVTIRKPIGHRHVNP